MNPPIDFLQGPRHPRLSQSARRYSNPNLIAATE